MKKILLSFLLVFAITQTSSAQLPYTEFKFGYFNPEDATDGYLFGLHLGRMIDESLSWGVEINYFRKTYEKTTEVVDPSQDPDLAQIDPIFVQRELEFVTQYIPVLAKFSYEHPISPRGPFYLRASAGIGWQFLWNREENFKDHKRDMRFFNGFGWQLATGLGIEISSKSVLFVDAFYNDAKLKRGEEIKAGLPTWEQLDISGIGLKAGVSIVGFGW